MRQDLKWAIVEQFALLFFTALLLDGGNLFRWTSIAFIGYWCGVLAIGKKRTIYQSRSDKWFVRFGSFALMIVAICIEPTVHQYIRW
jgi:hypothetical protein